MLVIEGGLARALTGDLFSYLDQHESTLQDECSAKTELAFKIAAGLQYIHAVGITHRDLHTGNILFDYEATLP